MKFKKEFKSRLRKFYVNFRFLQDNLRNLDKSGTRQENRPSPNRLQYKHIAELSQLGLAMLHPARLGFNVWQALRSNSPSFPHIVVFTKKPPMRQIMRFSLYCMNRPIDGRRID